MEIWENINAAGSFLFYGVLLYPFSLPAFALLFHFLKTRTGFKGSFWKLSVVSHIAAAIPAVLVFIAGTGGDSTPPPFWEALAVIGLGVVWYAFFFFLLSRFISIRLTFRQVLLATALAFTLLLIVVLYGRSANS